MILPTWVLCLIGAFFVIAISITGSCLVASYMDDGLVKRIARILHLQERYELRTDSSIMSILAKLKELETKLEKLEKVRIVAMKPIKGYKYDVVAMRKGAALSVLETLEYDDGVDFEEWLAEVRLTAGQFLGEDSFCDEISIVMRTSEERGHCHGIVFCRIPSKP